MNGFKLQVLGLAPCLLLPSNGSTIAVFNKTCQNHGDSPIRQLV